MYKKQAVIIAHTNNRNRRQKSLCKAIHLTWV